MKQLALAGSLPTSTCVPGNSCWNEWPFAFGVELAGQRLVRAQAAAGVGWGARDRRVGVPGAAQRRGAPWHRSQCPGLAVPSSLGACQCTGKEAPSPRWCLLGLRVQSALSVRTDASVATASQAEPLEGLTPDALGSASAAARTGWSRPHSVDPSVCSAPSRTLKKAATCCVRVRPSR